MRTLANITTMELWQLAEENFEHAEIQREVRNREREKEQLMRGPYAWSFYHSGKFKNYDAPVRWHGPFIGGYQRPAGVPETSHCGLA